MIRVLRGFGLFLCLSVHGTASANNDVLPRLLSSLPIDQNFLSLSYIYSEGNVAVDPSLALDVSSRLHTAVVSYSRSFAAFGQSASLTAVLPYSDLTLAGVVLGERVTASDRKFSDPRLRLAMNLAGAPALTLKEFAGYRQKTLVGLSFEVTPPLGHYDDSRRVNFGSNRWSFFSELGVSHRFRRITLEAALGGVLFTDNDDYLGSQTLSQKPIGSVRANVIYHLNRPGTWIGLSSLYLRGGETAIDGEDRQNLQSNSRVGVSLALPFARRHNLLLKFSSGVTTRIGADFDNYQIIYSVRF
jgi:hypothetical protein